MKLKQLWLKRLLLKTSKQLNQFLKNLNWPKIFFLGPFVFLSISTFSQFNKPTTKFSWVQDSSNPYKGNCYEYDIKTGGQEFQVKVSRQKCRPREVEYLWVENTNGLSGKCYEVDSETKGGQYSLSVLNGKCLAENKSFQFVQTSELSGECFQIISDTNRLKVKNDFCKTSELSYHWLSSSSGWGGKCYEIDSNNGPSGYINKVKAEACRPDKVSFAVKMSEFDRAGDCYEVDSENGRQAYSYRVRRENCFEQEKSEKKYAWKQVEPFKGECLESQVSVDKKVALKKSNYENCIDFKIKEKFIKTDPVSGVCVVVDEETSGKRFIQQISMAKCRNQIKEFEYQFITLSDGIARCYEIDKLTQGESYIKKTMIDECRDLKITPKWFADEEDSWSGKCLGVNQKGEIHSKKSLNPLRCRPEKVRVLWHNYEKFNGFCFEVDGEKGPAFYSKKIDISKCKPTFTKFIFYRKKDEKSGNCYDADSKTQGELYHKRVGAKSCKRELPQIKKD